MDKAKDLANKPETKEKIEQARERLTGKDKKPASGAAQPEPTAPPAAEQPPKGSPPAGEQPPQGNPPAS